MKNIQEYKEKLEKHDQQNQNYYLRLDFVGSHRQNKKWHCDFDRPNFKSFADYWQRIEQGVSFMETEGMGILWDAQVYGKADT